MKVSFTTDEPQGKGMCGAAPGSNVNIWIDGQQVIKQQLFNNECYESLMSVSFEQVKEGHFVFKICGHERMSGHPITNECFVFQEEAFWSLPKPLSKSPITELKGKGNVNEIYGASFDCTKAGSDVEKLICGNEELSTLDDSLNKAYLKALERRDIKKQMIKSQKQWLKNERNAYQNTECLKKAYETRIREVGFLSSKLSKSQAIEPPDKAIQAKTEQQHEFVQQRMWQFKREFSVTDQLVLAAEGGTLEKVITLAEKGGDVNARDPYGRTALMAAAHSGNFELVRFLVDKGADIHAKDYSGRAVLTGAAKVGNFFEVVKFLIDKGADVNSSVLISAAKLGNPKIAKLLLDKGLDPNAKDRDGMTALMLAAASGNLELVNLLIDKRADMNAKDKYGQTVLIYAAKAGNFDVVKFLIDKGIDVKAKTKYGQTVLMTAARSGNLELVKYLVDRGVDVNAKDKGGGTALMEGAMSLNTRNLEVVQFLAEEGADVNAKTETGITTLMFAIMNRSVVNFLIDNGADVNAKTENGRTALMDAAERGDFETAKLLIDKGADVNAKAKDDDTALKLARKRIHEQIEELLKTQGAKK